MNKPRKLPLDSPNWMLVTAGYASLCVLLGSRLAAIDLHAALRDGSIPAMRRFAGRHKRLLRGPERERLLAEHWDEHRFMVLSDGSVEVVHVSAALPTGAEATNEYVYFLWKPALQRRWPVAFAIPQTVDTTRVQPGPKPKDNWPWWVARWLVQKAKEYPNELQNSP
jgi:hypothetical protein